MENFLYVNNFDLQLDGRVLLSSLSFSLEKSICLLGESGSGKSLLLRYFASHSSCYNTDGKVSFYMKERHRTSHWKEDFNYFNLDSYTQVFLDAFFQNKEYIEIKCSLVLKILENPDFIFCEDLPFSMSDMTLLIDYLKDRNIRIFYVTNDIEKVTLFDYLIVIKNNQVAIEGRTLLVLKEEKLMKLLGFSLPFYVNLSIQLGYYGLIQGIYLNSKDLEAALWQSK